jgi:branched-chain amino acid transport system substrate-binding protein
MKKAGVDLVTTCMDTNGVITLAKEMKKQQLKAIQYLPNGYDQSFLDDFGDLFEGSVVRTDFVQLEAKEKPEGIKNFVAAMDRAGVKPSENAVVGWINADMFVAGLKAAGPDFSRQKVIDAVNKMTDYRADGILDGVDWTKEHTGLKNPAEACQFLSTIHDSKFDPNFSKPGKPFVCAVDDGGKLATRYDP